MNVNGVLNSIRSQGKKLTKTRKAIVEMLCCDHTLKTAPEIQQQLKSLGIKVNKTTVYRELGFLLENLIIKEVIIKPGIIHYESAFHSHHHHFTCNGCGNIEEVETAELESSLRAVSERIRKQGFQLSDHSIEFYGLCHSCH